MPSAEEVSRSTTGTVEWFDAERGIGEIRPDDGSPPCTFRSETLRECGIAILSPGDRVRFAAREEGDQRTATDLALIQAVQRWENEGGAVPPAGSSDATSEGGTQAPG